MDTSYESIIAQALLTGTPEARLLAEARVSVKVAVQRQITCPTCSGVLDQQDSGLVEARYGGRSVKAVGAAHLRCLGTRKATLVAVADKLAAARPGTTLEVATWNGYVDVHNLEA